MKSKIEDNHLVLFDIIDYLRKNPINLNFISLIHYGNTNYLWELCRHQKSKEPCNMPNVTLCCDHESGVCDVLCVDRDEIEIPTLFGMFEKFPVANYQGGTYFDAFARILVSSVYNSDEGMEMSPMLEPMTNFLDENIHNPRTIYFYPSETIIIDPKPSLENKLLSVFEHMAIANMSNENLVMWTFVFFHKKMATSLRNGYLRYILKLYDNSEDDISFLWNFINNYRYEDMIDLPIKQNIIKNDQPLIELATSPTFSVKQHLNFFQNTYQFYYTNPFQSQAMNVLKMRRFNLPKTLQERIRVANAQNLCRFSNDGMPMITKTYPYRKLYYIEPFPTRAPNELSVDDMVIEDINLLLVKTKLIAFFKERNLLLDPALTLDTNIRTYENLEEDLIKHYKNTYPHNKHGLSAIKEIIHRSQDCEDTSSPTPCGIYSIIAGRYLPH